MLRQNTVFDTGRMAVRADPGLDIKYNDLYNSHLQIMDLGTIYGWGTDGKDAEIAYNLVHDNRAELNGEPELFRRVWDLPGRLIRTTSGSTATSSGTPRPLVSG